MVGHRQRPGLLRVVLTLLFVAASAPAESSEQAAIKQFKSAAKTRLGVFKATLDGARVTALARIAAFDVAVATNGLTVLGVQDLVDDLAGFQAAVQEALVDVAVDVSAAGLAALGTHTPASIPADFGALPGGLIDGVRGSIVKTAAKTYRTVNKRLAKSSAAIGKSGEATFFAILDLPVPPVIAFSNQRDGPVLNFFAIDLRVSAATTAPDVTRLWGGGATSRAGIGVTVVASPLSLSPSDSDAAEVVTAENGRFLARLGDGEPLPRNNYVLSVVTNVPIATNAPFAIR